MLILLIIIFFLRKLEKIYKENYKNLSKWFINENFSYFIFFYMINKNYIIEILKSKSNEKYFELYNKIYIQISKLILILKIVLLVKFLLDYILCKIIF